MTGFAGTGTLARLALRLDRVRLPVWVLVIAVSPMATAAQYQKLYPDARSLRGVAGVISNPSLVAINGPLVNGDSIGGLTAWKIVATELILVGLMSLFTVVRHSRTEEETGRLELLGAGVVGRYAPLTAALLVAAVADAAVAVLVALGLIGVGLPAAGSVAVGVSVGATGLVFAAVAAVAAQLTESSRAAIGISASVLAGLYLLRAVGDPGPTWLSWLSPIGWAMRLHPYGGERWWLLGPIAALVVVATTAAYALTGRRDIGAGLLAQRPGPAAARPALRSPFALAWRLQRGVMLGWAVAMLLSGLVLGGAAHGIANATDLGSQISDFLARIGGRKAFVDEYLAAVLGITGLVTAAYTVQATLRLRAEESAGRVEPVLATRVGRTRWVASHLVFAVLGTAVLLALTGVGAGVAYGLAVHDVGREVPRLMAGALVQLPAAWVLAGLGVALFGLAPRATGLTWAALIVCLMLLELGALLGLNRWLVDLSPFAHVPKLPGAQVSATPLVWLTVVAVALAAAGLAGFRRRDLG